MTHTTLPVHPSRQAFTAARNACKMCTPLGACLAFTGIEGAVPLLHGSQGCSTYIRRYLISHFREPMDIASSNFSEQSAIFGGADNLKTALTNVIRSYSPTCVGVCTTCLSETIGDNVSAIVGEFRKGAGDGGPAIVHASTPSYYGSHFDGYIAAVRAIVEQLAQGGEGEADLVNVIPGMVSPADLRYIRELVEDFGLKCNLLPDYAERLDGSAWAEYQKIPAGGTPMADIRRMGRAAATLEMTTVADFAKTGGGALSARFGVRRIGLGLPIGIDATDALCTALQEVSGRPLPRRHADERGRLVDAYVDGHKYIAEKRVLIFGEEDMVISLAGFAAEIGLKPVLCASGGHSGRFAAEIARVAPDCRTLDDVDFEDIADASGEIDVDVILGNSKGYKLAKSLKRPLVRVGMPIHDRLGAARILHVGYRGTQQLFDRIANAILEHSQDSNEIGYSYL